MPVRIFPCQWTSRLICCDYQGITLSDFLFTFARTDLLIPTHLLYVEWKVNSTKVVISLKLLLVTVDVGSTYCTHRIKHHNCALKMSECLIHQTRALLHCSKGNAHSQVNTEFFQPRDAAETLNQKVVLTKRLLQISTQ